MGQYSNNLKSFISGIRWLKSRQAIDLGTGTRAWVSPSAPKGDMERPKIATEDNSIIYKNNWGDKKFLPLYLFNYGTRVLLGGACVSWSKWFYLNRNRYKAAAFMTRVLNFFDKKHGYEAGPILWGTKDTKWAPAGAVVFGLILIFLLSTIISFLLSRYF